MQSISKKLTVIAATMALSACAGLGTPPGLQAGQSVAVVNSLSWINPLSGKRDGVRTSWPLKDGRLADEDFPLAQLKQCDAQGQCAWGVLRAGRSVPSLAYADGGVNLTVLLSTDVARRQAARQGEVQTAMAIPKDVPALNGRQQVKRSYGLRYGKVEQIELENGVRYQVCAQRFDAARKPLDVCEIPYI